MFHFPIAEYPPATKKAVLFLCLGWTFHFFHYFKFLLNAEPARQEVLQIAVGVGICMFVAGVKKWARMLCIFFNFAIIGLYLMITYVYIVGAEKKDLAFYSAVVVALFALATFFLMQKETGQFFTDYNKTDQDGDESGAGAANEPK